MRHLFRIGFLVLLFLPWRASAVSVTDWSFANETFHENWQVSGNPSLKITREGLVIATSKLTLFGRNIDPVNRIEVMSLDYKSSNTIEGWIYWNTPGSAADDFMRVPITFPPTKGIGSVHVNITEYKKRLHTDFIGIQLPADSELLIAKIELMSWNIAEKILEGFKSFWTFDVRRPSSVNFVWGPYIVLNPLAREVMFNVTTPTKESANRYFYLVMVLVTVWAFINMKKDPASKKKILTSLLLVMAGLWIFYDIRMGSEFFGYVHRDYNTYWSRPIGQRTFRERSYFNDFAKGIAPLVQDRDEYVFTAPQRWPFLGLVRYYTYPSIPTHAYQEEKRVDTWVVYKRPDIQLNAKRELESEGIILSAPGEVLHEFEEGSFIFRETSL